jgi:hypothetical protein
VQGIRIKLAFVTLRKAYCQYLTARPWEPLTVAQLFKCASNDKVEECIYLNTDLFYFFCDAERPALGTNRLL